ncbi:hypothetical protein TNCV_1802331 [Trichonephila clavipes]|nr:hypothetical protein TNCV_1802331 [Trichonephila clavipes]
MCSGDHLRRVWKHLGRCDDSAVTTARYTGPQPGVMKKVEPQHPEYSSLSYPQHLAIEKGAVQKHDSELTSKCPRKQGQKSVLKLQSLIYCNKFRPKNRTVDNPPNIDVKWTTKCLNVHTTSRNTTVTKAAISIDFQC